jgi:hypothetical protein
VNEKLLKTFVPKFKKHSKDCLNSSEKYEKFKKTTPQSPPNSKLSLQSLNV